MELKIFHESQLEQLLELQLCSVEPLCRRIGDVSQVGCSEEVLDDHVAYSLEGGVSTLGMLLSSEHARCVLNATHLHRSSGLAKSTA